MMKKIFPGLCLIQGLIAALWASTCPPSLPPVTATVNTPTDPDSIEIQRVTTSAAPTLSPGRVPLPSSHCMVPNVENGEIASEWKGQYSTEDSVAFQCSAGFHLEGSPYVTCTENGSWKPELPKCVRGCKSSSLLSTAPKRKEFLCHGKRLEDLKPYLERNKLYLEIQKLQLEIQQRQKA
uniref:Membrane cofactor protein n=1 Tax=Geotrypetes seraphini TaxID=260995 RepID=A0A6P8NYI7_GEOSA|nr:membrane cofactor protein [Geotrypetes seraphini]XP_033773866.1 membrane cofactor protein [Geotrypetes seraphini]